MARKKAKRKKAPPKSNKFGKLDTTFACLICHHEKAIEIKMDRAHGVGMLHCRICGASFQEPISYLDQPIDVFCAWVDNEEGEKEVTNDDHR